MFKQILVTTAVAAALVLSGCAGKGKKNAPAPVAGSDTGSSYGSASDSSVNGTGLNTAGLDLTKKVIYFEYDSAELTAEGRTIVSNFAKYLAANPSVRLRLEGHADERGTREYNVGLGERRANSVQAALTSSGASANQLSVVSYGEERPAASGSGDSVWSQNRRVELVQQ